MMGGLYANLFHSGNHLLEVCVLLFVLNVNVCVTSDSYANELINLLKITNSTCGFVSWCSIKHNADMHIRASGCCTPCSCKQSCHYEQNCCPDKEISDFLNETLFETEGDFISFLLSTNFKDENVRRTRAMELYTTEEECLYSNLAEITKFRPKPTAYRMITKCSNIKASLDTKRKCENKPYNFTSSYISDVVPVQTNKTVYRNRHCLQCSNESIHKHDTWDVYVVCVATHPHIFQNHFESVQEITSFYIRTVNDSFSFCDLQYKPKYVSLKERPEICNNIDVLMCPSSSINEDIFSNTCKNNPNPIYTIVNNTVTVFNNFACLFCNEYSILEGGICNYFFMWHKHEFIGKLNLNFDNVANVTRLPESDNVLDFKLSSECPKGYLHDNMLDICRRILCPCGMAVTGGSCQPIFTEFIGVMYRVYLKIVPEKDFPDLNIKNAYEKFLLNSMNATSSANAFEISFFSLWQSNEVHDRQKIVYIAMLHLEGTQTKTFYNKALLVVSKILEQTTENIMKYMHSIRTNISVTGSTAGIHDSLFSSKSSNGFTHIYKAGDFDGSKDYIVLPIELCSLGYRIELLPSDVYHDRRVGHLVQIKRNNKRISVAKTSMFSNRSRRVVNVQELFDMTIEEFIQLSKLDVVDHNKRQTNTRSTITGSFNIDSDKEMGFLFMFLGIILIFGILYIFRRCKNASLNQQPRQEPDNR